MTVDCPRCGTTYRAPDRRRRRDDATYECMRCHHVFGPEPEAPEDDDAWRDEPEESAFDFTDEPPIRPRRRTALPAAPAGEDEDETGPPDDAPAAASRSAPAPPRRRPPQSPDPAEDDEGPPGGVARFALHTLVSITIAYAFLSVWASTHAARFQEALGRIPVVGSRLAETPLDPSDVALRDVRGEYEHLKSRELAFVIRATAVNLATVPLRRIQVEGRIHGAGERRQTTSCTDAPADVRNLPRNMLELMEKVRETRPAPVAVGGTTRCQVVFVDPPRPLRELSLEVVSVSRD